MKIRNPAYVDPANDLMESNKAAIQAFFQLKSSQALIDFDELRAAFPAIAGVLTDGTIAAICAALGLKIEQ